MQIYISHEREAKLRSYSKSQGKTLSSLMAEFIDNLDHTFVPAKEVDILLTKDNVEKPNLMPMCEMPFCKVRSEGKYHFVGDAGETVWDKNLCTYHWNKARKEGDVSGT